MCCNGQSGVVPINGVGNSPITAHAGCDIIHSYGCSTKCLVLAKYAVNLPHSALNPSWRLWGIPSRRLVDVPQFLKRGAQDRATASTNMKSSRCRCHVCGWRSIRIAGWITSPPLRICISSTHKLHWRIGRSRWHAVSLDPPTSRLGPNENSTLP